MIDFDHKRSNVHSTVRIFQIDTRYFVKCLTVVHPEDVVQVCAYDFVNCPAVSELPGSDGHALTRDLQLVLQTVLTHLDLIELSMSSYATANNMIVLRRHD